MVQLLKIYGILIKLLKNNMFLLFLLPLVFFFLFFIFSANFNNQIGIQLIVWGIKWCFWKFKDQNIIDCIVKGAIFVVYSNFSSSMVSEMLIYIDSVLLQSSFQFSLSLKLRSQLGEDKQHLPDLESGNPPLSVVLSLIWATFLKK